MGVSSGGLPVGRMTSSRHKHTTNHMLVLAPSCIVSPCQQRAVREPPSSMLALSAAILLCALLPRRRPRMCVSTRTT